MKYFYLLLILCSCGSNKKENKKVGVKKLKTASGNSAITALESKANILYENSDYQNAVVYLDSLIKMDSTNGEYYFKRGYSNGMLLNRQSAIKDYDKAITLRYRLSDAYFNAGLNCTGDNDSLALYYFEKSLLIHSDKAKVIREINDCKKRLKS